jgi:hypothetical protein
MKNLWLPLVLGAVGSVLLLNHMRRKTQPLRIVVTGTEDPTTKNFGAFPIDIPEEQFCEFLL